MWQAVQRSRKCANTQTYNSVCPQLRQGSGYSVQQGSSIEVHVVSLWEGDRSSRSLRAERASLLPCQYFETRRTQSSYLGLTLTARSRFQDELRLKSRPRASMVSMLHTLRAWAAVKLQAPGLKDGGTRRRCFRPCEDSSLHIMHHPSFIRIRYTSVVGDYSTTSSTTSDMHTLIH